MLDTIGHPCLDSWVSARSVTKSNERMLDVGG